MTGFVQMRELQAKGIKLGNLIENHEDGFYELDLKGNFVFFNRAILEMSGYTADELRTINTVSYTHLRAHET